MTPQEPNQNDQVHIPVLLEPVLNYLAPKSGDRYLDLTAGYGGHASRVLERTQAPDQATLVDRDTNAIKVLAEQFGAQGTNILHQDFYGAAQALKESGKQFDLILADLGVSSPHLNEAHRGFSIMAEGPLDMRMDQTQTLTAADIVNTYSEAQIADILKRYGEEPKAHSIAQAIIGARPLRTTSDLAEVVKKVWRGYSKVHPATRTFQALRIAVNDELTLLERSIPVWLDLLASGGRIAIISFHSLEDRIVKQLLNEVSGERYDAQFRLLTKRPITAEPSELVHNPRSRSAKLRVAVKK